MSQAFREIKENLIMRQVAEHLGFKPDRAGFILSPFGEEKTASCKLYRNSYYDFSTASGGDLIKFTALVLGVDNWRACQYLIRAFSLPVVLSGNTDCQEEIERRQRKQQRQEERRQEFKAALLSEIGNLKCWADIYKTAIEKRLHEPFSDMWCYCIDSLQATEYKLDILCATDQRAYRRMKPDMATGLPSDRPQWLLDTLAILAKDGTFQATQSELREIQAQKNFELSRLPGKDRICNITW
ncbi:MAG: hypothetical protein HFG66_09335 [Hungatella sp.]|nr:hypothetical protein [Hungatella sp.]